jgi:ATP-binding cassette, subfamily B, bacterial MsbA
MAWMPPGDSRLRRTSTMRNFFRLVRFAWPYRVRFWASLGCAVMVAALWGADIGSVYPLLQILLYDQNGEKWIAQKLETIETEQAIVQARIDALEFVKQTVPSGASIPSRGALAPPLNTERPQRPLVAGPAAAQGAGLIGRRLATPALDRTFRLAEASREEEDRAKRLLQQGDTSSLDQRRERLNRDLKSNDWWLDFYHRIEPWVNRYLPDDVFNTLLLLVGVVMVGVAIKGFFLFLQEVLVADIVQLSLFAIRNQFYRRTMALDLASFTDQGSAELMARFTNDIDSLSQGLNTLLTKVFREPLRIVSCLCVAFWLNWRLTCLTLVLIPISAATTYRVGKIMKRAVRRSLESMSNIYKILQESLQGIKVVKAFTMERHERRRFFKETKSLYRKSVRVAMIDALSDPVLEMLSLSTVSIALLAGSYLVLRRTIYLDLGLFKLQLASQLMAIEDLLTLYAMLAGVSDPVRKLANVNSKIQRASAASDRICALMDRQPRVADRPSALLLPKHRKAIEFDHVHFSYTGNDSVIQGLSLTVRHGERIALVGPNGCGKTTLMNLLPRFWDVQSGAIRIDGHDLREVRLRSLRSQIGMVTQETILFEDTVASNIAYGSRSATRAAIEAAAQRSYAHQFISALPDGYDTMIRERGMSLSGGQRQRIALARAMLRDPAILVLDEATSAVDIQDEALIRKAIEEFARNRTTFIITHSLGSIQFVDRIVLMNAGRIEAVGNDSELMRSSPLYRRLHEIHFQRESA